MGRSSLTLERLEVQIGVVDPDYEGEVSVMMHNKSATVHRFRAGDRIAQLMVNPYHHVDVIMHPYGATTPPKMALNRRIRGAMGFGSSGRRRGAVDAKFEYEITEEEAARVDKVVTSVMSAKRRRLNNGSAEIVIHVNAERAAIAQSPSAVEESSRSGGSSQRSNPELDADANAGNANAGGEMNVWNHSQSSGSRRRIATPYR